MIGCDICERARVSLDGGAEDAGCPALRPPRAHRLDALDGSDAPEAFAACTARTLDATDAGVPSTASMAC